MTNFQQYFWDHAREAAIKARRLPRGRPKTKQREVARVCHLLAKGARSYDRPAAVIRRIHSRPQ